MMHFKEKKKKKREEIIGFFPYLISKKKTFVLIGERSKMSGKLGPTSNTDLCA